MAFLQKVGNLVKRSAGSGSSLCQAIRCMSSSKVFIGGISYGTDEQSLSEAFASYGQVIEAKIIMDRETGRSRGFGFVTYASVEDAGAAISGMDGKDLQGRIVRVSYAHDRGSRAGGFGGGGAYGSGGGGFGGGGAPYGSGSGGYGGGGAYGSGGGGGYSRGGGYYDGGNFNSGYNTGGNYGVPPGEQGGYGSGAGYRGDDGGYNVTPANSGDSLNQGAGASATYGGGNYGESNGSYVNSASTEPPADKLDALLNDLKVDRAGKEDGEGEVIGLVNEEVKGDDSQDDLLMDDSKDADEPDDYANTRS